MEKAKFNKKQMKADGWREVPQSDNYWINASGQIYNVQTRKTSTPRTVQTTAGRLITEKVILWAFKNEPPRSGQITHINGNKADKRPENLKYTTLADFTDTETVNNTDLLTALRCYFELDRKHRPRYADGITKVYVKIIVEKRKFDRKNKNKPFFDVFTDYLDSLPTTTANIAEKQRITVRNARTIIARYTNILISEILADIENGNLILLPFAPTRREVKKRETELLRKAGIKRPAVTD